MYAIDQKQNPVGEVLRNFAFSTNQATALAQKIVVNPELLVEFEIKGVKKSEILEFINLSHKLRAVLYS